MGGGLELALGCHFRVAAPRCAARAARGQARAPARRRRHAAVAARDRRGGGAQHDSSQARACRRRSWRGRRCSTRSIDGDPARGAIAFARKVAAEKRPRKRLRDVVIDDPNAEAFLQFARNTVGRATEGLSRADEMHRRRCGRGRKAVRRGPADRASALLELMRTPESRALRHAFFAERAAGVSRIAEDAPTRSIERVAVIGAGTMGGGIAMTFPNAGVPVTIARDEAGGARQGPRDDPPQLRGVGRRGASSTHRGGRSANLALLAPDALL